MSRTGDSGYSFVFIARYLVKMHFITIMLTSDELLQHFRWKKIDNSKLTTNFMFPICSDFYIILNVLIDIIIFILDIKNTNSFQFLYNENLLKISQMTLNKYKKGFSINKISWDNVKIEKRKLFTRIYIFSDENENKVEIENYFLYVLFYLRQKSVQVSIWRHFVNF